MPNRVNNLATVMNTINEEWDTMDDGAFSRNTTLDGGRLLLTDAS